MSQPSPSAPTGDTELQSAFETIALPLVPNIELLAALSAVAENLRVDFPPNHPPIEEAWSIVLANIEQASVRVRDYPQLRDTLNRVSAALGLTSTEHE
jgi:hypothetical protein